jgi:hypothetical protein
MIEWLDSLSQITENAVRLYCSMEGSPSSAIHQFVLEKAYLAGCCEIIKKDIQKAILEYYENKEKKVVLLVA